MSRSTNREQSRARESELSRIVELIHREKGIPKETLEDIVRQAMTSAVKKRFGQDRDIVVDYNSADGDVAIYEYKKVVEVVENSVLEVSLEEAHDADPSVEWGIGDDIGFPLDIHPQELGRIAAMTAKQYIIQRVREAERDLTFNEFKDRVGGLISGIVRRFERGNIILELGKTEAILRRRHQVHGEPYRIGDPLQAYVLDISRSPRQPQVELSRIHPELITKLFELEVPEIRQGLVEIVSCARVPGSRAKIAVRSMVEDVDPVGACVGLRGSRVQEVVRSLKGEAIDIVPWHEDPLEFVRNAIAPADINQGIIDHLQNTIELIVPDDQLSKAIGRNGQNVRLASQLTGWKIDIYSQQRYDEIVVAAQQELSRIEGADEELIEMLIEQKLTTIQRVYDTYADELSELLDIDEEAAQVIIDNAEKALDLLTEEERIMREQELERSRNATEEDSSEDSSSNELPDEA